MSGPATSSSRRWVSLLSSSFAQCSEEAGVYGQCLAGKLTELEKGVCQKEFVQFNTCMQQAMAALHALV